MNQQIHRPRGKPFHRLTVAFGKPLAKVVSQQGDIFPPLTQRGRFNGHHIQAIVEILTKAPDLHLFRQIAMSRGDQPDIDRDRLVAAHALDFAFLNRPQQPHLHHRRDITNLIKKQRAAIGFDKAPFPALVGTGKCAFFMAEQL